MAKNGKHMLVSMSGVEKKFIRKYQEDCLEKENIPRKRWRELKTDALIRFRRVMEIKYSRLADESIAKYVKQYCPSFLEEVEKLIGKEL